MRCVWNSHKTGGQTVAWKSRCLSVESLRFHVKMFATDHSWEHPYSGDALPPSLANCDSTVFKQSLDYFFHFKVGRSLIVILSTNWPCWHYGGYRLSRSVTHGWFKGMLWLRGNTFLAPVSACLLFVVKSSRYRWGLNKVTEEHCSHINLSRKYEQFICNTLLIVPEKNQWLCIYLPELMCYIFFKIYVL